MAARLVHTSQASTTLVAGVAGGGEGGGGEEGEEEEEEDGQASTHRLSRTTRPTSRPARAPQKWPLYLQGKIQMFCLCSFWSLHPVATLTPM